MSLAAVLTAARIVNIALIVGSLYMVVSFLAFTIKHHRWRMWGLLALTTLLFKDGVNTVDRLLHHATSNPETTFITMAALIVAVVSLRMYAVNVHNQLLATSKEPPMTQQPQGPQVPEDDQPVRDDSILADVDPNDIPQPPEGVGDDGEDDQ